MNRTRHRITMPLALAALLAAAPGAWHVAHGQQPDPEFQVLDEEEAADAEPGDDFADAGEVGDEFADADADPAADSEDDAVDEVPDDVAGEELDDVPDDADVAEADDYVEDDSAWVDEGEWQSVPMAEDEDWAVDVAIDESEAAIPLDSELNPAGESWEVLEPPQEDVGRPAVPAQSRGDSNRWTDVPVLRRPVQRTRPPQAGKPDTPYSIGGKAVGDQGVPWHAQIYFPFSSENWAAELRKGTPLWSLQHECGGTLIARDWVLTAAHCIDEEMVRKGYRVRLGASDLAKGDGMTFRIERIVRHSQYASKGQPDNGPVPPPPNMYANDIALVRIADDGPPRPRDPARIRPIPLHAGPLAPGTPVSATGWGKTQDVTTYQRSALLMRVDLQVMDTQRCAQLPDYGPRKIHGRVICAASEGRSTCAGDSGGAIVPTTGAPKVVGIVSWGKGRCNGDGQPGVYTRVASYREWIERAMQLEPTKNALP